MLQVVAAAVLPDLATAVIERTAYPRDRCYPADAMPIVGYATGGRTRVYVAVMHSGVTLGPLMGQLISQEIALDHVLDDLEPYRVTRDFRDLSHKY